MRGGFAASVTGIVQVGGVKQVASPPVTPMSLISAAYTGTAIASGNSDGGDPITIIGDGFVASIVSITFGGNAVTSPVLVDTETITCVTPAHAVGAVDVVVTLS